VDTLNNHFPINKNKQGSTCTDNQHSGIRLRHNTKKQTLNPGAELSSMSSIDVCYFTCFIILQNELSWLSLISNS